MRKPLVSDLHDTRPRVRFRFFLSFRFFRSPLSFRLDSDSFFPFDSLDPPFIQELTTATPSVILAYVSPNSWLDLVGCLWWNVLIVSIVQERKRKREKKLSFIWKVKELIKLFNWLTFKLKRSMNEGITSHPFTPAILTFSSGSGIKRYLNRS